MNNEGPDMTDEGGDAHNAAPQTTPDEVRVSTIVGDRLCVGCGFNLTGQPVFKESQYNLFIARCPECGVVASMQEYPALGKWANRWAALAAALWLAVLAGGTFAFGMIVFGVSMGSWHEGVDEFADWVGEFAATDESSGLLTNTSNISSISRYSVIDVAWWESQDHWALLAQAGGFRKMIASEMVSFWLGIGVGGFVFGVIGSVALLHAKRLRLAFLLLAPLVITALFQTGMYVGEASDMANATVSSVHNLVRVEFGPVMLALTDGFAYLGILIGAMVGRPVARGLVRAFLPPRLRSSLSFLWLTDGKSPPSP
jgi:hypothetical protein